ncbi:unnamed protein product [Knipowitschia caucasica]|uniref:Amyloid beta A4 precursor protein-binding family B member 1-interacting protein n=1 Tax=Knipowitschia caucasica TaxID=637954 RepID=A0AAV2JXM5_KNICA
MEEIDEIFNQLQEEMEDLTQSLQSMDPLTDSKKNFPGSSRLTVDNDSVPSAPPPPPSSLTPPANIPVHRVVPGEATNDLPVSEHTPQIIKVWMADGSFKTLMEERAQTVREVLDKLFEKTHCTNDIDWSLSETSPDLHIDRTLEDHECLVEVLSTWTSGTDNKLYFLKRRQKHVMFTQPQFFYMWKRKCAKAITEQEQQLLFKENFESTTVTVPDLEGWLFLKDEGRKVWKPQYFVLRASGLYYVLKGKTKSSTDLACFVRFEQVNIYQTKGYTHKYKAPTEHCFVLKHPCIQKECRYVKFLCCEDEDLMVLWANSIRIAKYGTALYKNYKAAVKRAKSQDNQRVTSVENTKGSISTETPDETPPDFVPPPPPGYVADQRKK